MNITNTTWTGGFGYPTYVDIHGAADSNVARAINQMMRQGNLRTDTDNGSGGSRDAGFVVRNAKGDIAEIDILDEIAPFWGVDAKQVCKEIRAVSAKKIVVNLNSPGGDYFDGVTIYNTLKRHPADIEMRVDGLAASAASIIAMAGDKIYMSQGSQMMIHDAMSYAGGNAGSLRKRADLLDKCSDDIAAIYADRRGNSAEFWRAAMKEESWYNADEAVTAGLADAITDTPVAAETEVKVADWIEMRKEWGAYFHAGRVDAPAPHMLEDKAVHSTDTTTDPVAEVIDPLRARAELLSSLLREVRFS